MIRIGKTALVLALLLTSQLALALVEATVDRSRVMLGDTLNLTVSATEDGEDVSGIDISALQRDFEVLQRSTRSSTTIVNGQRKHSRQLLMEITPRRTGTLTIPALDAGSASTRPLQVEVSQPQTVDPGSEVVLFEAELDQPSVYVQGQIILTLRLQQAINLDNRSISELSLPGAFVIPLEQNSFQRTIGGRPWLVHEVRYAIFPEQSGQLEIPPQSFSARESIPRRGLFDSGRGKLIRRNTPALQVEVLPRPADYPAGETWLPARQLVIEEEWSADPGQLQAGSSITRSIRLRGEGLQGAQLPPVVLPPTPGLKFYPDQPTIGDNEVSSGLLGSRLDSTAIVPTNAGTVTLPEVRIPWWDIRSGQLRHAVLPARTLEIAPAAVTDAQPAATGQGGSAESAYSRASSDQGSVKMWQLIALLCALGWAITLYFLLRKRPTATGKPDSAETDTASRRKAYKSLLAACAGDQASLARHWLVQWAAAMAEDASITGLSAVAELFSDAELAAQIAALEAALYSADSPAWEGRALAESIKRLQGSWQKTGSDSGKLPSLYPTTG